jgi:membrane protein
MVPQALSFEQERRMTLKFFFLSLLRRIGTDNISFLAGGVAFYGLLALFPAMAAMVSLFGIFTKAGVLHEQLNSIQSFFPPNVYEIISTQLIALTKQSDEALSLTAIVSLFLTLFSATRGTKAMLAALNLVFRINENRKWIFRQFLSFFITLGALLVMVLAMFVIIVIPVVVKFLPLDLVALIKTPLEWLRWIILGSAVMGGVALLFAFGPSRPIRQQRLTGLALGSLTATVLWVAGAWGGSFVMKLLPQLHAAYVSLSAVVTLMLWMMISAYAILTGAAVTATLDKSEEATAEARD